MHGCPLRSAARQHRKFRRDNALRRGLAQSLYAALASAARRLDCFGLGSLLGAIPDSNEDFVHF